MSFAEIDALIGLDEAKRYLKFLSKASRVELGYVPPLLITSAFGGGKTSLAKAFIKSLNTSKGEPRKCKILNCASVKSVSSFFEKVYPQLLKAGEIGIIFDECGDLPKELQTLLLTPLNPEKGTNLSVTYKDTEYAFNLREWSIVFATTDPQKLSSPLRSRLTPITLKPYNVHQLGLIIQSHVPEITFEDNILTDIASTVKGNARLAVLRAKSISSHCGMKGADTFGKDDWKKLKHETNVLPMGLDDNEVEVLRILGMGTTTLSTITAATSHTRSMVQNQIEPILIRLNLMKIEKGSMRCITVKGREVLEQIGRN